MNITYIWIIYRNEWTFHINRLINSVSLSLLYGGPINKTTTFYAPFSWIYQFSIYKNVLEPLFHSTLRLCQIISKRDRMSPKLKKMVLRQNTEKLATWNWKMLILVTWEIKIFDCMFHTMRPLIGDSCQRCTKPYIKGVYLAFEVFQLQ
jgi:hypothetical protein